jgi:hypothetical protein
MVSAPTPSPDLAAPKGGDRPAVAPLVSGGGHLLPIADLFLFLTGRWRVERRVDAVGDGLGAEFSGVVAFHRSAAETLVCIERGDLAIGNRLLEARRALIYRRVAAPSAHVYFADGSFFHALDLSTGVHHVRHRCGADSYSGHFVALSWSTLLVDWDVTGPAKSYTSRTLLTRFDEESPAPP